MNLFHILGTFKKFNASRFESYISTYAATEWAINEMRANENVEAYHVDQYNAEFLYNTEAKTAVLLKFVIKSTKKCFIAKRNRWYSNPNDRANRITTTAVARNLIFAFMKAFEHYELVVPVGSHYHEACIFFRTHKGCKQAIYFNPNYSKKVQGVQLSRTANEVLSSLGQGLTTVQAYHSPCSNYDGKCSSLTWQEIYNFVQDGDSPFDNESLHLVDYNHLMTPASYRKYFWKATHGEATNHASSTWTELSKILIKNNASQLDSLKIMKLLNEVIRCHI